MVDYKKIYNALNECKGKYITAAGLAYKIGVERIYGATMTKLVREGHLEKCQLKGYYQIIRH